MRLDRGLLSLAIAAALLLPAHTASARNSINCALPANTAAREPAPLGDSSGNRFRVFWHIATQIEDLADAADTPAAIADIKAVQKLADGYFLNFLPTGLLVYWPGRPPQCAVNAKLRGEGELEIEGETYDLAAESSSARYCRAEQDEFLQSLGYGPDDEMELQFDAMSRALQILSIPAEQKSGKEVVGVLILDPAAMAYVPETDSIELQKLPRTVCLFDELSITPSAFMAYQEPVIQVRRNSFLWVPRLVDGKPVKSQRPRDDMIPDNARIFPMIAEGFKDANVTIGPMYSNIRVWNKRRTPALAEQLASMPEIAGFNFEGGSGLLALKPHKLGPYAAGMAWVLQNTNKNVAVLMPGYWPNDLVGNEAEIDTLPARVREYVLAINTSLSRAMKLPGGQNALCTGRIILIPGSYGRPVHVRTLPSMRNGKYAGTVTGQIRMLDDLRKEMCGS